MSSKTSFLLALFSFLIFPTVILQQHTVSDQFNDHAVNWLRDFVKRGKGSVSKLPFDEIFVDQSESHITSITSTMANTLTEGSADVVQIGGYICFPVQFNMTTGSKIIPISLALPASNTDSRAFLSASSSTTATLTPQSATTETSTHFRQLANDTGKIQFKFQRLASLLQQAIEKWKVKEAGKTGNDSLRAETVRSSFQQNAFNVSDSRRETVYRRVNSDWKAETESSNDAFNSDGNGKVIGRNQALERSVRYPNEILSSILVTKHKKESDHVVLPVKVIPKFETGTSENPTIYIIREGSVIQNNDTDYEFVSSITLVIDEGQKILVDTGLSTDINGRTWILQRLSELGAPPPSISHVVTTHGHPDHSGNTNHFPDAIHYAGRFMHVGTHPNFSRILQNGAERLTKNVYLLKTPGHTSEDISVFINNTSFFGTVIVSGDIFIRKEDIKDSTIWKQLATNELQQEQSRRLSICLADCIIPGHGPLFRVTGNMKRRMNCSY